MRSIGFNEGKACDAIVRLLELRDGVLRRDARRPEVERHRAPIDFACNIGSILYAVEHTGIEPFEGYLTFQSYARHYIYPVVDRVNDNLPTQDVYKLTIRLTTDSIDDLRLRRRSQTGLEKWIRDTALALPLVRGNRRSTTTWYAVPEFPFEVSLRRHEVVVKPYFIINYMLADDIEVQRFHRMSRACSDHFPKLAVWKRELSSRTVFVLEDNDMALTNEALVIDALNSLAPEEFDYPDEIFLVNTEINGRWRVTCLLRDADGDFDFGNVYDLDEAQLVNITCR